jgi:soluble cytochrome b562
MKKARIVLGCMLMLLFAAESMVSFGQTTPTLARFDEDVAQCRRVVRDYCAIVQQMMQEPRMDQSKQEKGLALLRDARAQWIRIQEQYKSNPPREYAADAQFKARLQDFANALEDMEKALAVGQPRRSFLACGFGCGLFVSMHEENGLPYALDALFHLRKTAKTTQALMKTRGLDGVRPMIPALMQKFVIAQKSPAPWPESDERMKPYREAMNELFQSLDELSAAVAAGDAKKVSALLSQLTNLINRPYTLAL